MTKLKKASLRAKKKPDIKEAIEKKVISKEQNEKKDKKSTLVPLKKDRIKAQAAATSSKKAVPENEEEIPFLSSNFLDRWKQSLDEF